MTDLPKGWAVAPLEQLTAPDRPICYGILMPKEHVEDGVPYVKVKDFPNGSINVTSLRRTAPAIAAKYERSTLRPGDVLVSIRGTYGRVATVPDELAGANITQDTARVTPSAAVDGSFLAQYLRSPDAQHFFREVARGVAVKGVNIGDLRLLSCPVPPMAEQRRIVGAIDEQLSRLDAAEASLKASHARLPGLRRAALQAAFPQHWPTKPLVEATDSGRPICYGILKPRSENGEIPYVEVRSIRDGVIDVNSLHRTTTDLHNEFRRSELRTGDVVLAIRGSWDRAAVVPSSLDGANVSRDVARIAPLDSLLPAFLAYFLESPRAQEYYARHARGVGVRGINIGDLRRLDVPIPDLDEQRAAVEALELQLSLISALATALDHGRTRSDHLRRAILTEAFSGLLVPQDPNDEPASELLARVAAERPAAAKPRQRKRA